MKKLLVIVPYPYLPWFSGGQKLIGQFLEFLGKEVELTAAGTVNNNWSLAKNYKGISLLKNSFSRYYDTRLVKKITALIKENNFDTVIWEHPYYWWLARKIKKRTGIKTIIHSHNIEYQRFRSTGKWWWPILKTYEKRSFKEADAIYFITEEDKNFAVTQWKINPGKCFTVPFGIDINSFPSDRLDCRKKIAAIHNIHADEKIFLFTGLLNYKPNLDAVLAIINDINPFLLQNSSLKYKIIICGKGLPDELNELKDHAVKNIIYAGFIEDIATYYKGADLFLNPVISGGGIKTKIVESIAYGTTVISTKTGALGIERNACGEKLIEVNDNDWQGFANAVLQNASSHTATPTAYYAYYYWGDIVKKQVAGRANEG